MVLRSPNVDGDLRYFSLGIQNGGPGHPNWRLRGLQAVKIQAWSVLAPPNLNLGQSGWSFVGPRDRLDSHLGAPGPGFGAILGPLGGNLGLI